MSTHRVQANSSIKLPLELDKGRTVKGVVLRPVVAGDILLITLSSGELAGFEEATGKRLWSVATPNVADLPPHAGAPVVDGDLVHVCAGGELLSIDLATGAVKKRHASPALDLLEGAFVDGCVVSFVDDERIEAWEVATGKQRWSIERLWTPVPLVGEGNLVVTGGSGVITALDVSNGKELWSASIGTNKDIGSLVMGPERSIIAAISSDVVCFDSATGAVRWTTAADVARSGTMAVSDAGEIHLMDHNRYRRLSAADGSVIASHEFDRGALPARKGSLGKLALSQSHVFAMDQIGPIIAVSPQTGAVEWKWEKEGKHAASVPPVLSDRRLYALEFDGTLQCFVSHG